MSARRGALLATVLLLGCGDPDLPTEPDAAPANLDAGPDRAGGCAVPSVPGLDGYVTDVVRQLSAAPRATAAARSNTRSYLMTQLGALGVTATVETYGQGANVVGRLPSTTGATDWIVVGAHFDTVPSSPGASDNATGVAVVLATARNLVTQPCRAHGVMFVGFDQEEVGLLGSTQLAGRLFSASTPIVAAHTVDQVGWDADGDRKVEIERPTASLWAEYQAAGAAVGVPVVRTTTGATDHESFRERGFAAVGVSEEFAGGDTTPHYHTAGDTFATVNLPYTARAAQLVTYVIARELGADP